MKFTDRPVGPGLRRQRRRRPRRASTAEVVTDVEVPEEQWAPIPTQPGLQPPATVLFVDGVRRVDAQVWVDEGDGTRRTGPLRLLRGGHRVLLRARRRAPGGVRGAAQPRHRRAATPRRSSPGRAPTTSSPRRSAPERRCPPSCCRPRLQARPGQGRDRGGRVGAREEARGRDDLLVLDGQLQGPHPLPRAIGFVKSHDTTYLDGTLGAVVGGLAAGERTPVFRIERPFPVLQLVPAVARAGRRRRGRGSRGSSAVATSTASAAVALADLAQVTLVRYASAEYKDARAPQNLYPIAGLERELRRRLGEPALLYRALRAAARLTGAPSSVAATHRSSTASWQLASSSACSTASGLRPICPVRAAQLLGTEHGLAVERPAGPARPRSAITQPQRLEPDHAHAAGQGRRPVPLQAHDAAVEHRPRLDGGHVQGVLAHGRDVLDRRPREHRVAVVRCDVEHRRAEGRAAERRGPTDCHGWATVCPRRPRRHHPTGCPTVGDRPTSATATAWGRPRE